MATQAWPQSPDGLAMRVYPNPWRAGRNSGTPLRFKPLSNAAVVRLFSLSGRYVTTLRASQGEALWDLKDADGAPVSSGFYFYTVEEAGATVRRGRVAVIQ